MEDGVGLGLRREGRLATGCRRSGSGRLARALATALGVPVASVISLACSQAPPPQPATVPAAVSRPAPPPAPEVPVPPDDPAPVQQPPPEPTEGERRQPLTVVIDAGEASGSPTTLLEASRLARERKRTAPPPVAVIDNENLAEYAERGKLTVAVVGGPKPAEPGEAGDPGAATQPTRDEAYWRSRARDLRTRWRDAVDQAEELEVQAEALRLQFYTEEDVYARDTRVKPAWDRVQDRLQQAQRDAEAYRLELEEFLEEGRKSAALPGWLREGIELEPEVEPEQVEIPEHEAIEPSVVSPPDGEGLR